MIQKAEEQRQGNRVLQLLGTFQIYILLEQFESEKINFLQNNPSEV